MKKTIIYLTLPFVLLIVACNDWLDVSPRVETKQDDIFSTESGFRSVLTGAYIKLAGEELYGKNTSYYFQETLARNWTLKTSTSDNPEETALGKWEFKNIKVEERIAEIWKNYYAVIVQLNSVLDNIDKYDAGVHTDSYNVIKGEAYGLRAFVHLEVLRLFGPMPETATDVTKAIPYVTEVTKQVGRLLSENWGVVKSKLTNDLDSAEYYLAKSDPLVSLTNPQLNYMWGHPIGDDERAPLDEWFYYRQRRFNYYAVKGTKARFYHWIGEDEKAVKFAKEVIESEKFRLTTNTDYTTSTNDYGKNSVMLSEQLFYVYSQEIPTFVTDYFDNSKPLFTQTKTNINKAYENHVGDIRLGTTRYWEEVIHATGTVYHFRKYGGNPAFPTNYYIPMLRLYEMYLILLEDLPYSSVGGYWKEMANARNLASDVINPDESKKLTLLENEYRKEFYGEGQMFYFYKRHNYVKLTYPSNFNVPTDGMVIPMPESQLVWDDGVITMD